MLPTVCSTYDWQNPSDGSRDGKPVRQTSRGEADLRAGGGGDAAAHYKRACLRHSAWSGDHESKEIKPELKSQKLVMDSK